MRPIPKPSELKTVQLAREREQKLYEGYRSMAIDRIEASTSGFVTLSIQGGDRKVMERLAQDLRVAGYGAEVAPGDLTIEIEWAVE